MVGMGGLLLGSRIWGVDAHATFFKDGVVLVHKIWSHKKEFHSL